MMEVLVFMIGALFGTGLFMLGRMSVKREQSEDWNRAAEMLDRYIDKYVDKIKEMMDL